MKPLFVLFFILFLHTHCKISHGVSFSSTSLLENDELEPMMESESSRRVLMMGKKYISYETLKRDLVPCGTPGASYYNCKGKGVANPYNRGCEIITRCARDAINT
ncbi:Rapid ALkalinization Factor [Artemisia annua]|uniref:Rapid ALkalinization Factor n=1 Tax=Artemisia annua TaxID=35608 RepID=A0A2U1QLB3_ARTAN|nr:Rapid ALkalinization Factor [Artemisia annua]